MNRKRLLVTGANGLLGSKVCAAAKGSYDLVRTDLQMSPARRRNNYRYLDITDRENVFRIFREIEPDLVINAAAITNVDLCEEEQDLAWKVNVEGVGNLVMACAEFGSMFVHISSDYVFNGRNGPYSEDDPTDPINYYGLTKLESEKIVLSSQVKGLVIRTMILYGYQPGGNFNFVVYAINQLRDGNRIMAAIDQWGNPTFADDLGAGILKLCEMGAGGLYHFAGGDFWTRYEMSLRIADYFGFDRDLVVPVKLSELGLKAKRPVRSGLKTDKVEEEFGIKPKRLEECLGILREQMDRGAGSSS